MLPLWFADKADYSKIGAGDTVETEGLADLLNGNDGAYEEKNPSLFTDALSDAPLHLKVTKRSDGSVFRIPVTHTMSADQLRWLRHGSALNYIRAVKSGEA